MEPSAVFSSSLPSGQLCVDVGIVRRHLEGGPLIRLREQQLHEHPVGDVPQQRPANPGILSCVQDLADGVVGATQFQFHGAHALARIRCDPQDISVVEQMKFLLDKCHTMTCAGIITEEFLGRTDHRDGVTVFS